MNMKKIIARSLLLSMTVVAFISSSNVAEAKVYGYDLTEENFPAADYADRYEDLKAAFGDDATALYDHYKYFGVQEGRIVLITKDVLDTQPETAVNEAKKYAIDVLATIINDDMTDAEKVQAVEAWMSENITYGLSEDNSCYHITGVMQSGPVLEEGYAETFEFFMDAAGIECITTNDLKANKVNVDGTWYDVDIHNGILF